MLTVSKWPCFVMNNLVDELLYDVYVYELIHELLYACLCWITVYIYIYVDDYYMNNMLMNYYMNAYVELTWWLYDAIKWWISMRL